jgi:acetoin utilization deacetylase AcuC-like enzyme
MTLLYSEPCFLQHETGNHPESADRIRQIPDLLAERGLDRQCKRPEWQPLTRPRLTRVHSPAYADEVRAMCKSGGGDLDGDTIVGPGSYDVAMLAAGCCADAVERLVRGEDTNALCLVRPPGHHALVNQGMGFCLFNNIALAAKVATEEFEMERVLVVDWDIHHGNGTQETFWEDPRVGFLSIHRWPFFPGTGLEDETGGAAGLGTTVNLPVPFGISRKDYLATLANSLEKFAARIKPQLVLLSAGFDPHAADPVGSLGLESEDFIPLTTMVLDVANTYADGKMISVLEGGYNPSVVAECTAIHLEEMLKAQTA